MTGLRERKRDQARAAIVTAAFALFGESGFDATTVAQIAEAANVSPRTLFRHFPTKDAIVFAGNDDRIASAIERIRNAPPDAEPEDVLLAALADGPSALSQDPTTSLRLRLIEEVPVVAGRAYRLQAEAERVLAAELAAAFPGRVAETDAAALVGAMAGALTALARRGIDASDDSRVVGIATTAVARTTGAAGASGSATPSDTPRRGRS